MYRGRRYELIARKQSFLVFAIEGGSRWSGRKDGYRESEAIKDDVVKAIEGRTEGSNVTMATTPSCQPLSSIQPFVCTVQSVSLQTGASKNENIFSRDSRRWKSFLYRRVFYGKQSSAIKL